MLNKKFFTIIIASVAFMVQAQPSLEIVGGTRPTTSSVARIVGKTDPAATATINGVAAKVYATGCFGAEVALNQGDNVITVESTQGGKTTTKTVIVVRQDKADKAAAHDVPMMRDVLFTGVTLPGAFLQYGNGTDRLGGSKMGYIDEGIALKVVGDYANLYKVQLSGNRFAYIQKEYVKMADVDVKTVNSSSITYSNMGKSDRVSISLPCKVPYYSWTQLDPTTICVEIFGAMCNSNWISQHGELGMVDYVDFRQVDSDVLQVVIKLKKKYAWGYDVYYRGNSLTVDVKHTPTSLALKDLTIGIDAGHGGEYSGAIGHSGLDEKTINLQLVKLVKGMLEAKGAKVVLSRSEDVDVAMSKRKQIFKEAGVDLAFAIHNNSGGSPLVDMGSSTYYKHIVNRELAAVMLKHLVAAGHKDAGLTGNFNFSLNMPTEYPNCLLEVLFMSSLPDEEKLCNPAHCKKIAAEVVAGLEEYLLKVKAEK